MAGGASLQVRFDDFQLDERNARLCRAGQPIDLPPKAFAVLCTLLREPGQLVTKDTLQDAVWGHRHISESVLKTIVSHLRGALADDARAPRYIETAARRGYRFIGTVQVASAEAPPTGSGLVGRAAALNQLARAWTAAARGERQMVFVVGEAGIGKSSLVERFAEDARRDASVAWGQCVEAVGAGEPYLPVLEALGDLARGEGGATMATTMRRVAPSWLAQLPWLLDGDERRGLLREVAGATQDRMLREAGELLDRLASPRPLLLVLEDLHWSDPATVQLIGYLARRRGSAALMVVATLRPAEPTDPDRPLADLRRELALHRRAAEVDLAALSPGELRELVEARLPGAGGDDAFVQRLHAHTGGLPLFATGVLDDLLASRTLRRESSGWLLPETDRLGVPAGLAGMVEKRLSRLPEADQRLLEAASVAGVEFGAALVAGIMEGDAGSVDSALDALARRVPWLHGASDGRYAFGHVLYRHVLYARIDAARRRGWHCRAALTIDAMPEAHAAPADLAWHFERGGEPELAVRPWIGVASRMLGRGVPREAVRIVHHALALPGDGSRAAAIERLELHVLEGAALARLHVISEPPVARAFEAAAALADEVGPCPARGRAWHGAWWVRFARGDLVAARSLARTMLARAEADADATLRLAAHSAAGLTLSMTGEFAEARGHLQSVLDLCAASDDLDMPGAGLFVQDPRVEARGHLALVLWWCGEPDAAHRLASEAIQLSDRLRHPISRIVALHLAAVLNDFAGRYDVALAHLERLLAVVHEHDLPVEPGTFSWLHGSLIARVRGDVDDGLAKMQAAFESCRRLGLLIGLSGYHLRMAETLRLAGRAAEAEAAAAAGIAHAVESGERCLLSPLHRLLDRLCAARGDAVLAANHAQCAAEVARSQGALAWLAPPDPA